MSLAGKTAFVSGAGRNIGRAVALELAARGCNLALNGASDERACEETAESARKAHGVEAMVCMGDIGRPDTVRDIAGQFLGRFPAIDIVVNNAAIRPHTPFLELTDEEWYRVLDVDLHAAFHFCRAFVPGMVERRWGRIVNLTGMNAIRGYDQLAPVSAAKHGLYGLTKALAKELGPKGITVNAVSPGTIRSERADPGAAARQAKLAEGIPVGRIGEPEDIAAAVGFLCSNEGGFVNGQMIASNGGVET